MQISNVEIIKFKQRLQKMNQFIGIAVCLLLAVPNFKAAASPGGENYAITMVVLLKFLSSLSQKCLMELKFFDYLLKDVLDFRELVKHLEDIYATLEISL